MWINAGVSNLLTVLDMPAPIKHPSHPHQLNMFDPASDDDGASKAPSVAGRSMRACPPTKWIPEARARSPDSSVRVVGQADLPSYPTETVRQIESVFSQLPAEKLWFTYQDIQRFFGVSRATIARRLKEGLVPGVRFQDGRMLEDGAVRRLDREQLRWLLLAVKGGGSSARSAENRRSR